MLKRTGSARYGVNATYILQECGKKINIFNLKEGGDTYRPNRFSSKIKEDLNLSMFPRI